MARIVGSDGNCVLTGYGLKFTSWSMTLSNVVTDTSAFADTFALKRGGLMSGTISATGAVLVNVSGAFGAVLKTDPRPA